MAFEELTLDPDLEDVLRDVANDPRARLFHVDPWRVTKGLIAGQLKPSRTGLTKAEDHLVSCYRRELAYLMRVGFLQWFATERTQDLLFPELPGRDHALHCFKRIPLRDGVPSRAGDLLVKCLGPKAARHEAVSLLSASLVLSDSPDGRCYLAHYYRVSGQHRRSRILALPLGEPGVPPQARVSALHCTGMSHSALGNYRSALHAYSAAAVLAQKQCLPLSVLATSLFSELLFAVVVGDRPLMIARARDIDMAITNITTEVRDAMDAVTKSVGILQRDRVGLVPQGTEGFGALSSELIHALIAAL